MIIFWFCFAIYPVEYVLLVGNFRKERVNARNKTSNSFYLSHVIKMTLIRNVQINVFMCSAITIITFFPIKKHIYVKKGRKQLCQYLHVKYISV
jgi:hypothetical protein